jgi:MFS family permease
VQAVLGGSARDAGFALTPLVLGWVMMLIVTGRVVLRAGYRRMVMSGLVCIALGFLGLTRIGHATPVWLLRADLAFIGMGMGMTMLSLVLAMQHAVDRRHRGVATSFGQFTRSIGGALGVAIMGAIVAASLPVGRLASGREMELGLHRAFLLAMMMAAVAFVSAMWIPRSTGRST